MNILDNLEDIFSFPAFVANTQDPLYKFNDTSFDKKYLKAHPLGEKAVSLANEAILRTRPENRICAAGGNLITDPDDYIFTNLLTSDENEELYQFNFVTLDKNNLNIWNDRERFIRAAKKFKQEDKWGDIGEFEYLDRLIEEIAK